METEKRRLYSALSEQKWNKAQKIYEEHPEILAVKINNSDDTALHVAITLGAPVSFIVKLVDEIQKNVENAMGTLAAKNIEGDTPLHCAASKGYTSACRRIIRAEQSLIGERNNEEETPLFLAALNGHKRTFLYLHSVCSKMDTRSLSSSFWKGKNGDTILHLTIRRKYFDLSFQIIHLYKNQNIAGNPNDDGVTPLDVLASVPSAFKSCTSLSWISQLYYDFIDVKELKFEPPVESYVVDIDNSEMPHQTHPQPRRALEHILPRLRGDRCSIREMKENHVWGAQVMEELVKQDSRYQTQLNEDVKALHDASLPLRRRRNLGLSLESDSVLKESDSVLKGEKKQSSALLTAAKYGEIELVKKILETFPVAIHDKTSEEKNIVLVAVEERQTQVLKGVMEHPHWPVLREAVDKEGNNTLHLAAKISRDTTWDTHGPAMQMQWEVKWYEYVKRLMPAHFPSQKNKQKKTPVEIFEDEHKLLIKESNRWLSSTSGVYSGVTTLIASGTFAACLQVPGGNDHSGKPTLVGQPAFDIFAIAVLFAFTFSSAALAGFVAVYSSRKKPKDYRRDLPLKLSLSLASLFVSCVSVLLAFYAAHSYETNALNMVIPLYFLTVLPIVFYTALQFPTYWAIFKESLTNEPRPSFVGEDATT